ncbi:MAG: glycosyltransferase family 4 protein [Candidatus Binatia bacterium]
MADDALNICLLSYRGHPQSGGQGVYIRLLTRELVEMGHRVEVWSGQPYPELFDGVELVKVPGLDLWNEDDLLRLPSFAELRDPLNMREWVRTRLGEFAEPRAFCQRVARSFRQANGNQNFDIIHDNQSLGLGLLEMQEHVPVVATIHHPITVDRRVALRAEWRPTKLYGLWRWYHFLPMQLKVARKLDRILTISEASTDDIAREFNLDRRRMRNVGNGINLDVFKPLEGFTRNPNRLITTLSHDVPLKGFSYLLDALAELRRTRPEIELLVIGGNIPRERTVAKIEKLGLQQCVRFRGRVPAEQIAREYAEAMVAVVPSIYEGFGFPAGEAMACEVPLVSTSGGALPEVVGTDGSAATLIEPRSPEALVRAIGELLDATPERRAEMGRVGRRRVLEKFTWRRAAERTVECYREVIEERRRTLHTDRPRTWAQVPAADSDEATATDDTTGIAARTGSQPLETC